MMRVLFALGLLLVSQFSVVYSDDCFNPAQSVVAATDADSATDVVIADINGDGKMDLASASTHDNKIAWYENGDWNDEGSTSIPHVVTLNAQNAWALSAGDIDGDGDMDLVSASSSGSGIEWHQNDDGTGTAWNTFVVDAPSGDYAVDVYVADINNDGSPDIVGSFYSGDGKLVYYENNGDGTTWTQHVIATGDHARGVYIFVADIDADGHLDILTCETGIAWYKQVVFPSGTVWTRTVVNDNGDTCLNIHAADINGDGRMDIAGAMDTANLYLYTSTDDIGTQFNQTTLDTSSENTRDVHMVDVDGNGFMDIVTLDENYENDDDPNMVAHMNVNGDASSWTQTIVSRMNTFGDPKWYQRMAAADIDGDGNVDLAIAGRNSDVVAWFRNLCNFDCSGVDGTQMLYETDDGNCNRFELSKLPALKTAVDSLGSSIDAQCTYTP